MRAIVILCVAAAFCGCANTEGKLSDLSWGPPVKSDYETMVARAKQMTLRRYPKGLDPDKTDEASEVLALLQQEHAEAGLPDTATDGSRHPTIHQSLMPHESKALLGGPDRQLPLHRRGIHPDSH